MNVGLNGKTRKLTVDDKSVTITSTAALPSNMSNIAIFGSGTTSTTNKVNSKLYSCQIRKGTDLPLVRDFVPCIDSSGAVGLYDLVGNSFYGNSGTGSLTAGPSV